MTPDIKLSTGKIITHSPMANGAQSADPAMTESEWLEYCNIRGAAMRRTAYFNRFTLDLPIDAVNDCSHQGQCDEDIEYWSSHIARPLEITKEALAAELKEYGTWDANELQDDEQNWKRLLWIAAGSIKDEKQNDWFSNDTPSFGSGFEKDE